MLLPERKQCFKSLAGKFLSIQHIVQTRSQAVAYGGGGLFSPPPEIPKALQNRAKLNPIVKTVKNCWIWTPAPQDVRKNAVKF